MATNTVKLTPQIEKRLRLAGGRQGREGACIICGRDWADCPHNRAQTDLLERAYELKGALALGEAER